MASSPTPVRPPGGSQLAGPLASPPEFKPPPEPSLWPLAVLGLLGLTCVGGCVGLLVVGIHWVHTSLTGTRPEDLAAAVPAKPPLVQANPPAPAVVAIPAPAPAPEAVPEPVAAFEPAAVPAPAEALVPFTVPESPEAAKIREDIREKLQQMREQFARDIRPQVPDVSPLVPALEQSPKEPPGEKKPPFPALDKPEKSLPLLEFRPTDLEPLGPEIRGDHLFQDTAPPGGWLVGFRVTKGRPWDGAIVALRPIYQVGDEYQLGQQCGSGENAIEHVQFLAKPGYAIGKIEARLGLIMNALRLEFYRVDGTGLIPADTYATDWFGAEGGSPENFDGGGSAIVGLAGSFQPEGEVIAIQVLRKKP